MLCNIFSGEGGGASGRLEVLTIWLETAAAPRLCIKHAMHKGEGVAMEWAGILLIVGCDVGCFWKASRSEPGRCT